MIVFYVQHLLGSGHLQRVRLVAESSRLRSDDIVTVSAGPGATTVCYDAALTLRGPLRVLNPLLPLGFKRVGDRAATGLSDALAQLAGGRLEPHSEAHGP